MKEVRSNLTNLVSRAGGILRGRADQVDCEIAHELMSPFIDSMATADEIERLQAHLDSCEPCHRQLQSFISIKNLMTRVESPAVPEDLVLNSRVRLSQERHKNYLERVENRVSDALKTFAIPAIAGVSLTMLLFGVLLGAVISNTTVLASGRSGSDRAGVSVISLETKNMTMIHYRFGDQSNPAVYKPVRTSNQTMIHMAGSDAKNWDEPLMIETHINDDGKVMDYRIISGPETPETQKFVREQLSVALFTPATMFGKPVDSKIILSFVAVRS